MKKIIILILLILYVSVTLIATGMAFNLDRKKQIIPGNILISKCVHSGGMVQHDYLQSLEGREYRMVTCSIELHEGEAQKIENYWNQDVK